MRLLLPWRTAFPFTAADGLPVLLYHKVGDYVGGAAVKAHYVAPALFRAHLGFLAAAGYATVNAADLLRYLRGEPLGVERPLAITFDDGYECVYRHAFPALREHGFGAFVFVVAGAVGGANDWEPGTTSPEPLLTAAQMREMAQAGIEFGSHGLQHRRMTMIPSSALPEELVESKRTLEDLIAHPVTTIAYPYGDVNDAVKSAAVAAGFTLGFATERGVNRPGQDPLGLKRVNIRRYNYLPLFRRKLRRAYGLGRARRG